MNPYWKLDHLQDVYLEDSWILSMNASPGRLEVLLDFVLRERHPDYSNPKPGEQYCYKRGSLVFSSVSELHWTAQSRVTPATDASGEIVYGSLDVLQFKDNVWSMDGDFGQISLISTPPQIEWLP
ncbi:hypothetical protein ACIQC5_10175 [Paenarthrobacter sp. NPDC092416]|uniref:hypothetical protein n=1 Tax=Paenarthrobacter sp. NPDC092416 TaxID=3364386 RepID=UPI0038229EA4